jgi:hypothetical protein
VNLINAFVFTDSIPLGADIVMQSSSYWDAFLASARSAGPGSEAGRVEKWGLTRLLAPRTGRTQTSTKESVLETLLAKIQKFTVMALAGILVLVVVLSTVHLGALIAQEIWAPPHFLIRVQGLLEIFGYFLLVLIGVELLETP